MLGLVVGAGDRVKPPLPLAGLRVVGVDEAADPYSAPLMPMMTFPLTISGATVAL